jgi:hypothetical protein
MQESAMLFASVFTIAQVLVLVRPKPALAHEQRFSGTVTTTFLQLVILQRLSEEVMVTQMVYVPDLVNDFWGSMPEPVVPSPKFQLYDAPLSVL